MTAIEGLPQLVDPKSAIFFPLNEALDQSADHVDRQLAFGPYWPDVDRVGRILAEFSEIGGGPFSRLLSAG